MTSPEEDFRSISLAVWVQNFKVCTLLTPTTRGTEVGRRITSGIIFTTEGMGLGRLKIGCRSTLQRLSCCTSAPTIFQKARLPADIANEINQILNEIDEYENAHSVVIPVILAKIINRKNPNSPQGMKTSQLNNEIQSLYNTRHAAGDAIILVDMENILNDSDYYDNIHPNEMGYGKMADVWLAAIDGLLDPTNAAPTVFSPGDQNNAEGDTVSLMITASDPDPQDTLTFTQPGCRRT